MRKIVIIILLIAASAGCDQKQEPKPQYQSQQGPVQALPGQTQNQVALLREAVRNDAGNINAWIELGNIMMDTSRFNEAIEAYQKALDINPKNVDVRVDMGTCYKNIGNPKRAADEYRKALKINPDHVNAHKNLAVVMMDDFKDNAQAINEFEKYLRLAPNAPDAEQIRQVTQRLKAAK